MLILALIACNQKKDRPETFTEVTSQASLVILGNIQDAGSPQIACKKDCCKGLFEHPDPSRKVVSLGVIDRESNQSYLFEATPDMVSQMRDLKNYGGEDFAELPDGIFLTHAHIGHYTGLMYLGNEAMNAQNQSVYAMPQMKSFLETNGPWDQLVNTGNIDIEEMKGDSTIRLTSSLFVKPFTVPHRDEYSETVGYVMNGPNKSALFIPDIDKWYKWDLSIVKQIAQVNYALIDGTFYDAEEINNRDISQIPHPFVIESMELFNDLSKEEKDKIYFIHFNHTNPCINPESPQSKEVERQGFNIARYGDVFEL